MEKEAGGYSGSLIIQKNTPIKRLGLSRKRKSCGGDGNFTSKDVTDDEGFTSSPVKPQTVKFQKLEHEENVSTKSHNIDSTEELVIDKNSNEFFDYKKETDLLMLRVRKKEEKLKDMLSQKNQIVELERLLELWTIGCKNAFLHFVQLLKDKNVEDSDFKEIIQKLGIWDTMTQYFGNDSDINILDFTR